MAGQTLTPVQIVALWLKAGGSIGSAPEAVARALAESSGRTAVTSPNPDGGTNVGVWQLDTPGGVGRGYTVAQLQNPLINAKATVKATNDGKNWSRWADNYQAFMTEAGNSVADYQISARQHGVSLLGEAEKVLGHIIIPGLTLPTGGPVPSALGSVLQLPAQVTGLFTALEKPVNGLMWFLNPGNWARIIAGLFGFLLLGAGLIALAKAA